jgi:hypothetical protein
VAIAAVADAVMVGVMAAVVVARVPRRKTEDMRVSERG